MCTQVLKEAWHKLKGMKTVFWSGFLLFALIAIGGFSVLGFVALIGHVISAPHVLWLLASNPSVLLETSFALPIGLIVCLTFYYLAQGLFEMFALLPMRMGLRLIPLRRAVDKSIHPLFVFKFFTWHYIGRFIWLQVLVALMVGVPGVLGLILFCIPSAYHFGTAGLIISYVFGLLFLLIALYLVVSYLFANLCVIDRNITAWQALELSRKTVSKKWFCIFGYMLWIGFVLVVGAALFLVGLIWAIPYAQNIIAILYRDLIGVAGQDPVTMRE